MGRCLGVYTERSDKTLGCDLELVCNEAVLSREKGTWYPRSIRWDCVNSYPPLLSSLVSVFWLAAARALKGKIGGQTGSKPSVS